MSRVKVNKIEKRSGNNIAVDDSLNLKSYSTTDRDALTSAAGDIIYNSTENKPQFYNGSEWGDFTPVTFALDYLIIAGGGAGASGNGGGGGAGGYRTSAGNSGGATSAESSQNLLKGINFTVTVGGGGASANTKGSDSVFSSISSLGGGSYTGGSHTTSNGSGAVSYTHLTLPTKA